MAWVAVVSVGAGLVGSYMSADAASEASDQAAQTQQTSDARIARTQANVDKVVEKLNALVPPDLLSFVQPYQKAVIQGQITPEQATFQMLQDSKMQGITIPAELLATQSAALTSLNKIASEGGMTAIDRARLLDIQTQEATRARGEQEAMAQNAAQRGITGSGMDQANRMLSQQASATRSSNAGVNVAAEAQKRALEAIQASGTMAGSMRTQDVAEQSAKAQAADAIAKYNNSFQNATNSANVASANQAQAANLAERQRIAEYNIGQAEREAAARLAAAQTGWQNTIGQTTTAGNLTAGLAGQANTAGVAANTLANSQNQQAAAQTSNAITQGTGAVGELVKLWKTTPST